MVQFSESSNVPAPYLDGNERPPLPLGSKYVTPALQDLVRACWDKDPTQRPSFSQIVPRAKSIRKSAGELFDDVNSPRLVELPEPGDEAYRNHSPDIRPVQLPPGTEPRE